MNESFYESRAREKINDLMKEGVTSQAYYRSRASNAGFLYRLPKFILVILGIVGVIQIFIR